MSRIKSYGALYPIRTLTLYHFSKKKSLHRSSVTMPICFGVMFNFSLTEIIILTKLVVTAHCLKVHGALLPLLRLVDRDGVEPTSRAYKARALTIELTVHVSSNIYELNRQPSACKADALTN